MNQQEVSIRKNMAVYVPDEIVDVRCTPEFVLTINANLQSLGFSFSKQLFDMLLNHSKEHVASIYEEILPVLKEMVGAHRGYKPMYPNFPEQVMEASDAELYGNAMAHYWGSFVSDVIGDPTFVMLPQYDKKSRPSLEKIPKLRMLDGYGHFHFHNIFSQLILANSSISETDKEILKWFIENKPEFVTAVLQNVDKIPQKETLAYVTGSLPDPTIMFRLLKTATDILRVAVAMSGGDVSLATPCKFKSFSKKLRRFFMQSLENCGSLLAEDMLRWQGRWIRLGECIHPGDFSHDKYPKAITAFDIVRNSADFRTFTSKVETAIKNRQLQDAIALLSERGGVFARRLDHLLRLADGDADISNEIVTAFSVIAKTVSTPVLLQVYNHFKNRKNGGSRTFFPKGNVCKLQVSEEKLPSIDEGYCLRIVEGIRSALVERFKNLPSLGNVYLDENLQNYFVPFALRSASKALKTLTRGSHINLPEGDCVRMFLWWKNLGKDDNDRYDSSRVDIDLSVLLLDDEWSQVDQIAYYNLRDYSNKFAHSGDITSAPNGACEFIDVDMTKITSARYVVMTLNSYTMTPYCNLPECFAGWMMREGLKSGEVFDARTVENKIDLAADSTGATPLILDLKERKMIWCDLVTGGRTLYGQAKSIGLMCKAIAELNRPKLYDLFSLHVEARGNRVSSPEEADMVFAEKSVEAQMSITPFDLDRIMSQFMTN